MMGSGRSSFREENQSSFNDVSRQKIYDIATGSVASVSSRVTESNTIATESSHVIQLDKEMENLLNWLAAQQGIDRSIALKKALVTMAYLHDITSNQGGQLLVQRQDSSVGKVIL